jgi:hypothetical protein
VYYKPRTWVNAHETVHDASVVGVQRTGVSEHYKGPLGKVGGRSTKYKPIALGMGCFCEGLDIVFVLGIGPQSLEDDRMIYTCA